MSDGKVRTLAEYVAQGVVDAELAALLWVLAESATPVVVAAEELLDAEQFRHSIADAAITGGGRAGGGVTGTGLADVVFPGRALGDATSLEDVVRLTAGDGPATELPDAARDLGVVVILRRLESRPGARVTSAHYVRPIERDGAGHIQRRPPALLAAWNDDSGRLDHFDWGIADELATRASVGTEYFERLRARRRNLLEGLVAARVFGRAEFLAQIERAALAEMVAERASRADAPN